MTAGHRDLHVWELETVWYGTYPVWRCQACGVHQVREAMRRYDAMFAEMPQLFDDDDDEENSGERNP